MENLNIELGKLELNENVDSLLYHYTSINSLFSIIENKEFWVTRSDYMNDTSEVIYFREVVKKALDNHLNKACTSIEWVTWKQFIKDKLIYERSSLSSLIFILSFSKNPDSLSMWNYYGKNDGYNFGILKSDLDLMMKSKYRGGAMKSGSLIYEFDLQVDILVNELKNAFEIFCKNPSVEGILERVTSELSQRFFDYSFFSNTLRLKMKKNIDILFYICQIVRGYIGHIWVSLLLMLRSRIKMIAECFQSRQ